MDDEIHLPRTNAARRLYDVLAPLESDSQLSTAVIWQVFAAQLRLNIEEPRNVFIVGKAIERMARDLDLIRHKLISATLDPDDEDLGPDTADVSAQIADLMHPLTVYGMNLGASWKANRQILTKQVLQPLRYWRKLLPLDEYKLPTPELGELATAVREARAAIADDHHSSTSFKATLLELLSLIEDAIAAYAYGGMPAVQAAIRSFEVAAYASAEERKNKAESDSAKGFERVRTTFHSVMELALRADAVLRLVEIGGKLLIHEAK